MRRNVILKGDRTTAGGIVVEGDESSRNDGRPIAYEGALIECPSCNSMGYVVNLAPYRPMTFCAGKQVALEDDQCACKCSPPPLLVASRDDMFMTMDDAELAQMGHAPDGSSLETKGASAMDVFDRHFQFVDERGEPVGDIAVYLTDVDLQTTLVKTSADGRTPVITGKMGQRMGVRLALGGRQ